MKSQNENSSTDQKKTNNKRYAFAQRQGDDFSCIKIMDGQYEGIIYKYNNVKFSTTENADGSTTVTLDHTGVVTDKEKGDGYYSQPDGVHTIAYHVGATLNDDANISLKMQGSLATTPTEDDWFDISGTTINQDNIDGSTLAFHANFTGNFVWVRAKVSGMSAGSVSKILYNH